MPGNPGNTLQTKVSGTGSCAGASARRAGRWISRWDARADRRGPGPAPGRDARPSPCSPGTIHCWAETWTGPSARRTRGPVCCWSSHGAASTAWNSGTADSARYWRSSGRPATAGAWRRYWSPAPPGPATGATCPRCAPARRRARRCSVNWATAGVSCALRSTWAYWRRTPDRTRRRPACTRRAYAARRNSSCGPTCPTCWPASAGASGTRNRGARSTARGFGAGVVMSPNVTPWQFGAHRRVRELFPARRGGRDLCGDPRRPGGPRRERAVPAAGARGHGRRALRPRAVGPGPPQSRTGVRRSVPGSIPSASCSARSPLGVTLTARSEPIRTHHPASSA